MILIWVYFIKFNNQCLLQIKENLRLVNRFTIVSSRLSFSTAPRVCRNSLTRLVNRSMKSRMSPRIFWFNLVNHNTSCIKRKWPKIFRLRSTVGQQTYLLQESRTGPTESNRTTLSLLGILDQSLRELKTSNKLKKAMYENWSRPWRSSRALRRKEIELEKWAQIKTKFYNRYWVNEK